MVTLHTCSGKCALNIYMIYWILLRLGSASINYVISEESLYSLKHNNTDEINATESLFTSISYNMHVTLLASNIENI